MRSSTATAVALNLQTRNFQPETCLSRNGWFSVSTLSRASHTFSRSSIWPTSLRRVCICYFTQKGGLRTKDTSARFFDQNQIFSKLSGSILLHWVIHLQCSKLASGSSSPSYSTPKFRPTPSPFSPRRRLAAGADFVPATPSSSPRSLLPIFIRLIDRHLGFGYLSLSKATTPSTVQALGLQAKNRIPKN